MYEIVLQATALFFNCFFLRLRRWICSRCLWLFTITWLWYHTSFQIIYYGLSFASNFDLCNRPASNTFHIVMLAKNRRNVKNESYIGVKRERKLSDYQKDTKWCATYFAFSHLSIYNVNFASLVVATNPYRLVFLLAGNWGNTILSTVYVYDGCRRNRVLLPSSNKVNKAWEENTNALSRT